MLELPDMDSFVSKNLVGAAATTHHAVAERKAIGPQMSDRLAPDVAAANMIVLQERASD
jgi:hypothetical protein